MCDYEVLPQQSIGPVVLRMSQEEVHRVLGVPSVSLPFRGRLPTEDSYGQKGFNVHYDSDCCVRLIEVFPTRGARFLYRGVSVFETTADELIGLIGADAPMDSARSEFPATVIFPSLELALWRHCLPEESGGPEGTHFESLSIGVPGYFSRAA